MKQMLVMMLVLTACVAAQSVPPISPGFCAINRGTGYDVVLCDILMVPGPPHRDVPPYDSKADEKLGADAIAASKQQPSSTIPPPSDGSKIIGSPQLQNQNLQNQLQKQNLQNQLQNQQNLRNQQSYQAGQQLGDAIGQAIFNHRMAKQQAKLKQQQIAAEIAAQKVRQQIAADEHFGMSSEEMESLTKLLKMATAARKAQPAPDPSPMYSEEYANTITSREDCALNGFFVWDESADACHRPDVPTPDREDVSGESFSASVDPEAASAMAKSEVQRILSSKCGSGQLVKVIYGSHLDPPNDTDNWRDAMVYANAQCIKAQ